MDVGEGDKLLVRLAAKDVAMFRYLLEAHENLAMFSVLQRRPALLKLVFARDGLPELLSVLDQIGQSIPLKIRQWPMSHPVVNPGFGSNDIFANGDFA